MEEEEEDDDDDDDEDDEMQDATAGATGATGTETSEGGDTNTKTKGSITKRPVMVRLNLDTDPKSSYRTKGPNLKTVYTTTHKEPVTCTTFSKDGRYAASGSADTSLKILDVNKMKLVDHDGGNDVHPVIRTLYDHTTVRISRIQFGEYLVVFCSLGLLGFGGFVEGISEGRDECGGNT